MTVAVVGAGPAGVGAALGCAGGGAPVILLEGLAPGGEAVNIEQVTDLPGQRPISGADFAAALTEQVLGSDIDLRLGEEVGAIRRAGGGWQLETSTGTTEANAIVFCAGAGPVPLPGRPPPNADPLLGNGLFTCAVCDGPLYAGRHVAVAGGGDTGAEAALTLSRYAARVVLYERELELTARPSLVTALADVGNVEVRLGAEVTAPVGETLLQGVRVSERGEGSTEPADGVMIAVGMRPRSDLVEGIVELDAKGGIKVGMNLASSAAGLFAAGDARAGSAFRCATAFGDGMAAARGVLARLNGRQSA
jgi:thioredoxin reductase (NADPH)